MNEIRTSGTSRQQELSQARFGAGQRTLIKQAVLVTGTSDQEYRGDILLEGGKIKDIARTIDLEDAQIVDGFDYLVAPGFVDTHRHMYQTAHKAMAYDLSLMQSFHRLHGGYAAQYRPQDIYASTYLGRLAALDAGITTVLDWSNNIDTDEAEEQAIQALRDAGGRSLFGHGYTSNRMIDLDALRSVPRNVSAIARTRERLPTDDSLITPYFLAHEPGYFISLEACVKEYAAARELGLRISTHIASMGPGGAPYASVEALHGAGLMGPDVTYIHLTAASDVEMQMIADTGGSASVCAQTESHMAGFRVPPIGRLLAAGVRPSLSVDTVVASSDDFFSQMRAAFDVERMVAHNGFESRTEQAQITVRDVFEFATYQGAKALGMERSIGTLEAGKSADLLIVRTTSPNMMPVNDPMAALVFSATIGDIDTVLVGGNAVKRNGVLLADVARARNLIEESVGHLYWREQSGLHGEAMKPHPGMLPRCLCGRHAA